MLKGKETLTPLQKKLLFDFGKVHDSAYFFLTGGTALAEFFLGHRHSYDLDLFTTEKNLVAPFSTVLERELREYGYVLQTVRRFESFVEIQAEQGAMNVQIHLAYDSPFRFAEPELSEYGVKINDYQDLVADKVLTFFGRWMHRDAVDLFFILKREPIDDLLKMAKQKDPGFDLYWFAVALGEAEGFSDDINQWPVEMLCDMNVKELKQQFSTLSKNIMDEIKNRC